MNHEIKFYKELAKELKPQGFKCFLYNQGKKSLVVYHYTSQFMVVCR